MHQRTNDILKPLLLLAFIFAGSASFAATTAGQVLAGIKKAMFSKPSIEIMFTLTSDGASTRGSAVLQDAMFTVTTPQFMAWYDGKTQWAFQRATEEVNISEPTADEVMALNPFGILGQPDTYYNSAVVKESGGTVSVKLTPKAKGTGIVFIVIDCASKDYSPRSITVSFDDGRSMTMTVDSLKPGTRLPATNFRYNPSLYPAREIIDLR